MPNTQDPITGAGANITEITQAEHDSTANVQLKKTGIYAWDSVNLQWVKVGVNSSGQIYPAVITGAPLVGQKKIAVTGTAVQLPSNVLTNGVIIYAKSTNAAPISIGGSGVNNTVDGTGNGLILEAGAACSLAVANTNQIYINGTAGDICSFIGS